MVRVRESILANRKLAFSGVLALALVAGVIVSLTSSPPRALADYYTGCSYGYGSSGSAGSFGSGSGIGYGYGYVGSHFAYGYGNEVCPMSVTTSSLAAGTAGTSYSQTLTATGGTGTFTWSETGGLDGLAFSSGGALTGTPSTSGTFPITFTATDGNGATTSASLSLSVAAAGGGGGGVGVERLPRLLRLLRPHLSQRRPARRVRRPPSLSTRARSAALWCRARLYCSRSQAPGSSAIPRSLAARSVRGSKFSTTTELR